MQWFVCVFVCSYCYQHHQQQFLESTFPVALTNDTSACKSISTLVEEQLDRNAVHFFGFLKFSFLLWKLSPGGIQKGEPGSH